MLIFTFVRAELLALIEEVLVPCARSSLMLRASAAARNGCERSNLTALDLVRLDRIAEQHPAAHRVDPERAAATGLLLQYDADVAAVLAGSVGDEALDLMR